MQDDSGGAAAGPVVDGNAFLADLDALQPGLVQQCRVFGPQWPAEGLQEQVQRQSRGQRGGYLLNQSERTPQPCQLRRRDMRQPLPWAQRPGSRWMAR
jgi:hypothetical protein